jgi:hypothetical protein
MDENLEIFYDIKAMFTDAMKNPQFNAYLAGTLNNYIASTIDITGFNFNTTNRYIEIIVLSDDDPMIVVGNLKSILCNFICNCTVDQDIRSILYSINNKVFSTLDHMVKMQNQLDLMKVVNYMYSILFMGNVAQGHLFRIMM